MGHNWSLIFYTLIQVIAAGKCKSHELIGLMDLTFVGLAATNQIMFVYSHVTPNYALLHTLLP